uniref:Solute carrier family 22 member 17 n=1 Tax=Cyprinus carpio TaxID=7962 RepID=A0A8C2HWC7_CYPCA
MVLALGRKKQRLLIALSILPNLFLAFLLSSDPLLTLSPAFCCRLPRPSSAPQLTNGSVRTEKRAGDLSQCKHTLVNGTQSCVKDCDAGYDYNVTEGLTNNIVTEWDLVCSRYWLVPVEEVCFILGTLTGCVCLGYTADRLGRHKSLLVSLMLAVVFGVLVCVSPSPPVFITMRFCLAAASAGVFLTLYVTRLELCDPSLRLLATMMSGLTVFGGELLLLAVALGCGSWRGLLGTGAAPLSLFLCYGIPGVFPESPRWLLLSEKTGDMNSFSERQRDDDSFSGQSKNSLLLLMLENDCKHSFSLLHSRNIWKNLCVLGFTSESAMTVFSIMGLFSSQAAASLSILFTAEVMPTIIRGSGVGAVMALGCVGRLSSPLMNLRNHYGYFLHHVVYSSLALLAVLSILLLPESKRKPLPQTLADGEQYRRPPLVRRRRDNVPLLATPNPET